MPPPPNVVEDALSRVLAERTAGAFKRRGNYDLVEQHVASMKKLHKVYDELGNKIDSLDRATRRSAVGRSIIGEREKLGREIKRQSFGYMSDVFDYAERTNIEARSFAELEKNYRYQQRSGHERVLGNKSNYYWRQIGLAGAHAFSGPVGQLAQQVPVAGQAISAGVGSFANMLGLGAGFGSALKLGGLAALAAGAASYVGHAYSGYQQEESLRGGLYKIGGARGADSAIGQLRKQGFLSNEIAALAGSYGRATGQFEGVGTVGRYDYLYGIGGGITGLAGMMSSSGARGDQTKFVKDAIASGVVQGLERGRMSELIEGISRVAGMNPLGVGINSAGLSDFATTAGMIGRMTNMRGGQLYQLLGGFDATTRGHGNALQQSAGFLTAYDYLQDTPMGARGFMSGASTAGAGFGPNLVDIFRLQDRGTTGQGGMGLKQSFERQMRLWMRTTGLTQRDYAKMMDGTGAEQEAAKKKFDLTALMINEGSMGGSSINAATKLLNGFMGGNGSLGEKDIEAAMKDARPVEDKQYEEMRAQTDIQRRIQFNTEAIGRLSPGGENFNKVVEWATSGVASMVGGGYKGFRSYEDRIGSIRSSANEQFGDAAFNTMSRLYGNENWMGPSSFGNAASNMGGALTSNKIRRIASISEQQLQLIDAHKDAFGSEAQLRDQQALWKGISAAYGAGHEDDSDDKRREIMRNIFAEGLTGSASDKEEVLTRREKLAEVFIDIMRRGAETFVAGLANPNSNQNIDTQRLFPGMINLQESSRSMDQSSLPPVGGM